MENQRGTSSLKSYLKMARFDHWIKQAFVLPGVVFAAIIVPNIVYDSRLVLRFVFGMISLCLIASANYVINEWLDAEFDRYHPVKKYRPAVTENVIGKYVYIEYALFVIVGLVTGFLASIPILIVNTVLLFMGIVYNVKPMRSKDIPFLDVLSESINNALRLLTGWFIITPLYLPPSTILFGYWMGGAFLMAIKRFAEFRMINNESVAGLYRKSFIKYSEKSLLVSAVFYAMLSLFFCGIFIVKYRIEFVISIPFICGLYAYYLAISYRFDSPAQKPEALFKEKGLMLYLVFLFVLFAVLAFVDIPGLDVLQNTMLIGSGY